MQSQLNALKDGGVFYIFTFIITYFGNDSIFRISACLNSVHNTFRWIIRISLYLDLCQKKRDFRYINNFKKYKKRLSIIQIIWNNLKNISRKALWLIPVKQCWQKDRFILFILLYEKVYVYLPKRHSGQQDL